MVASLPFTRSPSQNTPRENHLLAALPREVFDRLLPDLELVAMPLGEVLCESGGQLQHVYFPTSSLSDMMLNHPTFLASRKNLFPIS